MVDDDSDDNFDELAMLCGQEVAVRKARKRQQQTSLYRSWWQHLTDIVICQVSLLPQYKTVNQWIPIVTRRLSLRSGIVTRRFYCSYYWGK